MQVKLTDRLEQYIVDDLALYNSYKDNAKATIEYVRQEYVYLIGKKVRVYNNKGWNTGIIKQIYFKISKLDDTHIMRFDVIGPNNQVLLFDEEEVDLID